MLTDARRPVDVNRAPREALLRVPGLGVRVVNRILATRRLRSLRIADLTRLAARKRYEDYNRKAL